jgi:hypothetical protein
VASNADTVGRLLATSTLMKGERELLRKQDEPAPEAAKPDQRQTPTPISHDSKSTAAVLLKLLDDRLQASEVEAASPEKAALVTRRTTGDDASESSKRVSARYVEDGLTSGSDIGRSDSAITVAPFRARDAMPTASLELQTFLQRLAAFAAGRPDGRTSTDTNGVRDRGVFNPLSGTTVVAILVFTLMLVWLTTTIFGWHAG